jgi:hypothetical protein
MVRSARSIAVAVLVAGVVMTSPIHGSSMSAGQATTRQETNASFGSANFWSLDWLQSFFQRSWAKAGGIMDPSGGSSSSPSQAPSTGGTLAPGGSAVRQLRPTLSLTAHPDLAN